MRRQASAQTRAKQRCWRAAIAVDPARRVFAVADAAANVVVPSHRSDGDQLRVGAGDRRIRRARLSRLRATATWLLSARGRAHADAAVPDWNLYYAYARWRPSSGLAASSHRRRSSRGPRDRQRAQPSPATLREREIEGGVLFPIRHARRSHQALVSVARRPWTTSRWPDGDAVARSRRASGALTTSTARTYGYSISPEGGVRVGGNRGSRPAKRSDPPRTRRSFTADVRAYLPCRPPITCSRFGSPAVRRRATSTSAARSCSAAPARTPSVIDFGRDALSLLRGFPATPFAGSHVALAERRLPMADRAAAARRRHLAAVLHTVHAAVFADAGQAWTRTFRARRDQDVSRRRALAGHRRRLLLSRYRDGRARRGATTAAGDARANRGDASTSESAAAF